MSKKVGLIAGVAVASGILLVSTGQAQDCVGDCDGDGQVAISELIRGVNITLGSLGVDACPAFDPNGDDVVAINELIGGVGNALNGCLPPPGFEERVFTVVPGMLLGEPSPLAGFHSRTGLFTSGLGSLGPNVADAFSEGPLVLVRGPEDENGVSPLSLRDDVFITVTILDGSLLCIRMLAEDSGGSIACSGGVPYDVEASQPAGDVGLTFEVRTGLGPEAGPGSANLLVMQQTQPIAAADAADFDGCETADYTDPPQLWAYTTELATAIKATTGSDRTLAVQGEPFSCDTFGISDGDGMLAAPAPTFDPTVQGVANVFRLADRAAEQ